MTKKKMTADELAAWAKRNEATLQALDDLKRERARDHWQGARERAVARGVHVSRLTPAGYDKDPDTALLVPNHWAPFITEAYRLKADEGKTWGDIADYFTANGVVNGFGNARWTHNAARGLLANPVYLGRASSGAFTNENAHPALVDKDTWDRANGAHPVVTRGEALGPSLLAGILRCAGCRYGMKPDTTSGSGGTRVRLYRCRGRHAGGVCMDRGSCAAHIIEPAVVEYLMNLVGHRKGRNKAMADLTPLRAEHAAALAEYEAFRDDPRIITMLGVDEFASGLRTRQDRVEEAEAALHDATAAQAGQLPSERTLRQTWPHMTIEQQRLILASVFDCIFLRSGKLDRIEDRLLYFQAGTGPKDLPRRGNTSPVVVPLDWGSFVR